MRCYHCDQPLGPGDRFCPHCGAASGPPQPLVCPRCHAAAPNGAAFCANCGAALYAPAAGPVPPIAATPPPVGGGMPNWSKIALGGAGGLMLGSLMGGHHGGGFGWGDHHEGWGDRDEGWSGDGGDGGDGD